MRMSNERMGDHAEEQQKGGEQIACEEQEGDKLIKEMNPSPSRCPLK